MPTLTHLPDLVLERIVEHLLQHCSIHEARRACASLCTVSRSFSCIAARELYRNVHMEYEPDSRACRGFAETVKRCPDLASYVRSLSFSSSSGWSANHADSRKWASLMQAILSNCPRVRAIRFIPDEDAKNHEEAYLSAWTSSTSLKCFTLVFRQFRELVLLPSRPLNTLVLELQQGGDMNWDYDILLRSWPTRRTQVETLRVANLALYAYAEDLHLGMLAQVFRAISPPRKLELVDCCFSAKILDAFLLWAAPRLEELDLDLLEVVDGADRAAESYIVPTLPQLVSLKICRTDVRIEPR